MALTPEQEALSSALTNLQRKTVLGVVAGLSQRQAYYEAGGKAKTDESADATASEILSTPTVKAFHDSLIDQAATSAVMTREGHLDRLRLLSEKAEAEGKFAAAVTAEMARGKVSGFYVEKLDHTSSDGSMVPPRTIILCAPEKKE